ncbi:hypothetical protein A3A03_01670 [Candidatus Nomurabacteria bacterium RIFCSPLOWO2_01_FULL_40_18]|uniref:Uncharacterized protein n=1 Tax=Candidatus Nomurabacteria bacterium RIFCSPLOWO2_01_FULL_40_18 TaxID=1801773 RepID=A0A1F6XI75_9BACT|nr:MAG: hypothetical protein A3A03_01670 [Candidatus Nomurabacteria bacterium RIFCSPLOWO2_01_FULL_40_18]
MKKIIYNLRRQPEAVRRHILHVSTIVAGVILVLLWIYSLGTGLANPDTQTKINNDLKPLNALKANLIGGYQSITESKTDTE